MPERLGRSAREKRAFNLNGGQLCLNKIAELMLEVSPESPEIAAIAEIAETSSDYGDCGDHGDLRKPLIEVAISLGLLTSHGCI